MRIIGDTIEHSAEQNEDDGVTTQKPRRVLAAETQEWLLIMP